MYAYYQRSSILPKLGKEIPYFNILFMFSDRYVLDELVKILPVSKIKDLNSLGYTIGKMINISSHNHPYEMIQANP